MTVSYIIWLLLAKAIKIFCISDENIFEIPIMEKFQKMV